MKLSTLAVLIICITGTSFPQYGEKDFSIGINAVYTTTARLYLSPNSSDQTIRNDYFPLEDIFNPAIEIRYRLTDRIIIGLGSEYMEKTQPGRNLTVYTQGGQTRTIVVDDGFRLIPLEFSAYYLIPFSTEDFKFLMGGGAGYYIGEHIRKFGDAEVSNVSRKTAYGIHVLIGMDYMFRDNISFRFEMKFRDPQFNITSKYSSTRINYEGGTVTVPQETFPSKINVDGVTFLLGAAFHF
jgi:outer membrane protein W